MDGNRTRRRRITTTTRFEGGGCHQVTGHLRAGTYLLAGRARPRKRTVEGRGSLRLMKKLLFLAILVSLTLADELTRSWSPEAGAWNTAVPTILPLLRGLF